MIITFANFKGGVGKTTTTALFSYLLSKNYKVLAIDTDPQCNLTETLLLTYHKEDDINVEKNIYQSLFSNNGIEDNIQNLTLGLDILPGSWDMINFEEKANEIYYKKSHKDILKEALAKIKDLYDFILIDTAPTTSLIMDNVIMATDRVVITTQTLKMAYASTKKYYNYLLDRYKNSNYSFELLGVLPYLVGKSATDKRTLDKYSEIFEEELFLNSIKQSDRVKTWSDFGITEDQPHDKSTLEMYQRVVDEALKRL